jgi:hypothetical protein
MVTALRKLRQEDCEFKVTEQDRVPQNKNKINPPKFRSQKHMYRYFRVVFFTLIFYREYMDYPATQKSEVYKK